MVIETVPPLEDAEAHPLCGVQNLLSVFSLGQVSLGIKCRVLPGLRKMAIQFANGLFSGIQRLVQLFQIADLCRFTAQAEALKTACVFAWVLVRLCSRVQRPFLSIASPVVAAGSCTAGKEQTGNFCRLPAEDMKKIPVLAINR